MPEGLAVGWGHPNFTAGHEHQYSLAGEAPPDTDVVHPGLVADGDRAAAVDFVAPDLVSPRVDLRTPGNGFGPRFELRIQWGARPMLAATRWPERTALSM